MLVYIDDHVLLSLVVSYLDLHGISYTTDCGDFYDSIIVAQYNVKTFNLTNKCSKVIFISYLLEKKLFFNFSKYDNTVQFINGCDVVIVGFPFFRNFFNVKKCYVVPYLNVNFVRYKKKLFKKNYKYITFVDLNYKNLSLIDEVVSNNLNFNYNIIGYNFLGKNNKKIINSFGNNVIFTKYCDSAFFLKVISDSSLIVFFNNILDNYAFFNLCALNSKNVMLFNSELYNGLFVNNKNIYLFDSSNLLKVFNKIINNRVSNLGEELYNVFCNNEFDFLSDKFCQVIK